MDQKVTPDVLCAVTECVIAFLGDNLDKEFTKNDIRFSNYAQTLTTESFNKPNLKDANSEYDKFFAQPLKTLAYSKVLIETKRGNTNVYKVKRFDILEFISLRERNALNFLEIYLSKVILESGFQNIFNNFSLVSG